MLATLTIRDETSFSPDGVGYEFTIDLETRAEFWVESLGDEFGRDTTDTGTYLDLTTDQVRFYSIEVAQNQAHVTGGGYYAALYGAQPAEPLSLDQVPDLVFSDDKSIKDETILRQIFQ